MRLYTDTLLFLSLALFLTQFLGKSQEKRKQTFNAYPPNKVIPKQKSPLLSNLLIILEPLKSNSIILIPQSLLLHPPTPHLSINLSPHNLSTFNYNTGLYSDHNTYFYEYLQVKRAG